MSNFYKEYYKGFNDFEKKYAPDILFFEGDERLLVDGVRISIVGSRDVSREGRIRTKIITETLVSEGIIIVSGLAKGVDTIAHQTAIANNGKTIAVLGTPLDKTYPSENKGLHEVIRREHLVLSQFSKGAKFNRSFFPMRNRTMALISDATIIIEASEKSGTRHQGWEALRLGRTLFLMESLVKNPNLSWPKKMIDYGAQILTRENIAESINELPHLTSRGDYALYL
jgi:DNA processing protein